MKDKLKLLKEQIEEKRKELDLAIDKGLDAKSIYQINIELDNLIAEYIKYERQGAILEKYDYILNNPYKEQIISGIMNDVRKEIKNISDYELECYCNNVYVYACLRAYKISEDEIAKQILCRNNIAAEKLESSKCNHIRISKKFNTNISTKYYGIVKEKIANQNQSE